MLGSAFASLQPLHNLQQVPEEVWFLPTLMKSRTTKVWRHLMSTRGREKTWIVRSLGWVVFRILRVQAHTCPYQVVSRVIFLILLFVTTHRPQGTCSGHMPEALIG